MKELREHIKNNRVVFDDKEPSDGHMGRFEALLDQQEEKITKIAFKKVKLVTLFAAVASIAILVVVGIKFYEPQQATNSVQVAEEHRVSDEFHATNSYYNKQMQEQIADLMCKLANADPQNQARLNADLQKLIEENNRFVKEIARSDNQELAIAYLVKHYKTNIQVLENINEKLGKHTKC